MSKILDTHLRTIGISVLYANQKNTEEINDILNYVDSRIDTYSICILQKGSISIHYDQEIHHFEENSVFIVSSFIPFNSSPVYSETFDLVMLTFASNMPIPLEFSNEFTQLITYYFGRKFYPIKNLPPEELVRMKAVIDLIHTYLDLDDQYAYRIDSIQALFKVFFYELVRIVSRYAQLIDEKPTVKKKLFMDFFLLVKQEFKVHRDLPFYSDQLFVTAKYLSEVVKVYYGASAKKLIEDIVIHESKYLLADQTIPIFEIASTLNFNDQSMFGKYFKNATGLSPKAYRDELEKKIIKPI
ncbi:helix-turn-helix domain-containing protein [Myroides sp. WP-1]|uniref:AraC family transcriptional regulator n=1 Tax=Myroides sp. WP-1 TaxID=2759944 RepID=UPI001C71D6B4|nr:helix-turn-helix domain-containing protein [Myroides sp. WP-1]